MRCDGCKYWKKASDNEDWEAYDVGFGKCLGVRERWRITDEASNGIEWDSAEDGAFQTRRRDALRHSRAYVQDGSEYRATLLTAPDFFCALHISR